MGKAGKWLKSFLTGKKIDKEHFIITNHNQISLLSSENSVTSVPVPVPVPIPQGTPKEKKRWSFRRSSASRDVGGGGATPPATMMTTFDIDKEQEKHAMAVAAATAAAVAAAQAAAAVIRLTTAASVSNGKQNLVEEAAAIKIQSVFRSYLARKALCALKGIVKLQGMVRGHLVRKRAADTLRCMQALVTAQTRARTQRIKMAEDSISISNSNSNSNSNSKPPNQWQYSIHRKSFQENRFKTPHQETEKEMEENIKIVEMDRGEETKKSRNSSYSISNSEKNQYHNFSPAQSTMTETFSPRTFSGHFEDHYSITSPKSHNPNLEYAESIYNYENCPSYMANTESSKAKVRSQSAPKARPDSLLDRQLSRRRISVEGRNNNNNNNIPRGVKMQRSSSHLGPNSAGQRYVFQWPINMKLDKSTVSLKDSECGSTCSVSTNPHYYARSSISAHDIHGSRF